jgi:DNA-binding transcriptional ArsR family regulator
MVDTKKIKTLFEKNLPVFDALGDPIRQQLIILMIDGCEKSVAELAAGTNVSRSTVSHHLKILKSAHIVTSKKVGTKTFYFPQMGEYFEPMRELVELVARMENQKRGETNG